MKKKIIAYTPADEKQDVFFKQLENSLRKFQSEKELPLVRYELKDDIDNMKWYRATPMIAKDLIEDYEIVLKLDVDQIITGKLDMLWNGEKYDAGLVFNDPTYPIQVWDISPYFNNGLVVIKSKAFVDHWWRLCNTGHFFSYQFKEQDLLNILASDYFDYTIKALDTYDGIYGEYAKPLWATAYLKDGKIMLPVEDGKERELKVIHFGGGNDPNKGNFKIRFQPEVVEHIERLIK